MVVGCESTFNGYWLCDSCEEKKIPFILGHALYLKAIHGGKVKSDKIDSEKLARLLRGGNFAISYAYPSKWRSTRDLLRRRSDFVRHRGETLAHIQIVNYQQNLAAFPKKLQYKSNREGIADRFTDPAVAFSIQSDIAMLNSYDTIIRDLERFLERSAKVRDASNF
ncbi:hypothetical protein OAG68_02510 [bacterium]|nr:hypothetical protein [bacterium]